jgi:hypothetical protein
VHTHRVSRHVIEDWLCGVIRPSGSVIGHADIAACVVGTPVAGL